MKASQLQIGDYVKCCDFLVMITRIDKHSASGLELVSLIPILLTTEILEKNGFENKYDNCFSYSNKNKGSVFVELKNGGGTIIIVSTIGNMTIRCKNLYVHELQHALRVCGLNKEADNFKI